MINRPRRLRYTPQVRELVRETHFSVKSLVLPLFVEEGNNIKAEISSLKGQYRYSPDRVIEAVVKAQKSGVNTFILFGIPKEKDDIGSQAWDDNGVIQQAIREIKKRSPHAIIVSDVCLCEYTSHGHCGLLLNNGVVDNDTTLPLLAKTALSHAAAGADMLAPSDMMDGRVAAIRTLLDQSGYSHIPIMSYSAKYASAFYGPFREAAGSAPSQGDRKSYQMDYNNAKEALYEITLDLEEGADILIVKPALSYLDIIKLVSEHTNKPVAAYSVSGEYAMIKTAAEQGLIDEYSVMCEVATSIFRAGANVLITYWAEEIAQAIAKGDIG